MESLISSMEIFNIYQLPSLQEQIEAQVAEYHELDKLLSYKLARYKRELERRQRLLNKELQQVVVMQEQQDGEGEAQVQVNHQQFKQMPMAFGRLDNVGGGGSSVVITPYEHPLVWEFVGKGRYLQAAFCKSVALLYSAKFGKLTAKNLSNIAAKGARLGLLGWCKKIGCRWDESVFVSGASGGNVEVLGYLVDKDCPLTMHSTACTAAARGGHVEALMFLSLRGCSGDKDTFTAAARNGHLNVLQFAHRFRCGWNKKKVCEERQKFGEAMQRKNERLYESLRF